MFEEDKFQTELIYLEPRRLSFFRQDGDALRMTVENDRTYLKVGVSCAFPLSDPLHFIGVRDADGPEVGVIRDMRELDHSSRQVLEEALSKHYFTPVIKRFNSIRQEFGAVYFEAETDKGPREFIVRGLRENVVEINPGRYLITDADGNRFEVPDISRLDQKSLVMWERII